MAWAARYRGRARACFLVACAYLAFCAAGSAEDRVRLRVRDASGFAGTQVVVDVAMEASPWPSAVGFWLEYDTNRLTFVDANPGAAVTLAGKDVSWDFPAPGRVSFLIFGLNNTRISPGKLLSITFAIDEDAEAGEDVHVDGLNASSTDPDAAPIPTEVDGGEVNVLECFQPAAPAGFTATDGAFGDRVQLSWLPVFGAQSYVVYRNTSDDPETASILAVTVLPFYSDFSALGADYVSSGGGGGCGGSPGQTLEFTEYYYWIQAKNICGESELAAESGWRGKNGVAAKSAGALDALPTAPDETTAQVALRLTADSAIEPASVTAEITSGDAGIASVAWQPSDDAGRDGWAIVALDAPPAGDGVITVRAAANTVDGNLAGPASHTFVCRGAVTVSPSPMGAKQGDSFAVSRIETYAAPDFIESMGARYSVYPPLPFAAPQRIQLPVPDGAEPGELLPYLYDTDKGWRPANTLEEWLVRGSMSVTDVGGKSYVAFDVRFGGIVQLGYPPAPPAPQPANWAGGVPTALATLALLLSGAHRCRAARR